MLVMTGCNGSADTNAPIGRNMAGPAQTVVIAKSALESRPKPWVLATPEAAVRSYLDWVSYAYRIAQSEVATPTMSPTQEVRVDSYVQYNLESSRLIDQRLVAITFGKLSVGQTHTIVPAKESWAYRYVSIKAPGGTTIGGPYTASYDTTYTVVKSHKGSAWVVDAVDVKALGKVK